MGIKSNKPDDPSSQKQVDKSTEKRAGFFKTAAVRALGGLSLKASKEGYKSVRYYVVEKVGSLAMFIANKKTHTPPDVARNNVDQVKIATHFYDDMYAAKHPEAVMDFTPPPVSQEIIDEHTPILEEKPGESKMYSEYVLAEKGYRVAYFIPGHRSLRVR